MRYKTNRFGTLEVDPDGILLFPEGLVGHDGLRHFVLLTESSNPAVGWLQSLRNPDFAVAVVTPQEFVKGYALKIHRSQLSSLPWSAHDRSLVLTLVSRHDEMFTLNLRAPVIVNLDRCLGKQMITADDQPIQFPLSDSPAILRKIA